MMLTVFTIMLEHFASIHVCIELNTMSCSWCCKILEKLKYGKLTTSTPKI